jgi:RNA polymerase sigma-70 factor (ECF subfamily)
MKHQNEAFDAIVARYYEKILSFCSYFFGGNRTLAEDCTQDIFIVLYNSMDKLQDYDKIGGWLYKTAGNLTKQYAAALKKEHKHTMHLPDFSEIDEIVPDALVYEEFFENSEDSEAKISSCTELIMKQLKEDELAVLRLSFGEKLSIQEVAEALHISGSAAKSRINRLRHKITGLAHDLMRKTE